VDVKEGNNADNNDDDDEESEPEVQIVKVVCARGRFKYGPPRACTLSNGEKRMKRMLDDKV
jgi:hypothetical protein